MGDAPSMVELFEQIRRSWTDEQRTWFPGRVVEFDLDTKMAQIQPLITLPSGQEMPVIVDVRVCYPGGVYWDLGPGKFALGETGIVLVGWRSWASWRRSGEASVPEDDGLHELDYATFLPGLWSDEIAESFDLPAGATVIDSSDLRLGDASATKAVVHEDLLSGLRTFIGLLSAWVTEVDAAVGPLGTTAALQLGITDFDDALGLNDYISPTVTVED